MDEGIQMFVTCLRKYLSIFVCSLEKKKGHVECLCRTAGTYKRSFLRQTRCVWVCEGEQDRERFHTNIFWPAFPN